MGVARSEVAGGAGIFLPAGASGDGLLARVYRDKYTEEAQAVTALLGRIGLTCDDRERISRRAAELVEVTRASSRKRPLLDAFLAEYGLSNQEGISLMCLAEALLRVPDDATRDALIADKISAGAWMDHVGRAGSLLVNVSTLGLLLTGRVVALEPEFVSNPAGWMSGLIRRSGEPVIRAAVMQAMRILGQEFVLGQSIMQALSRAGQVYGRDWLCSFDMLGESARTRSDAARYLSCYFEAIEAISECDSDRDIHERSGISVKLSALHPRYEYTHHAECLSELGESLYRLCERAARSDVALTVDAEESDRLELSLHLLELVAERGGLSGWEGLGLAVQAYGKRALAVIDWAAELAERTGRRMQLRLVKGAYWDAEIKAAQIRGMSDFPVYTRKVSTDVSYMACAGAMLERREHLYCQFATHNAHTVCAVMHLLGGGMDGVEFQRLHGMGELLYAEAGEFFDVFPRVRVYAPVGEHSDVLAYLVRRLLENGANSSFVNRFMDALVPSEAIVRDPVGLIGDLGEIRQSAIPLPCDMFGDRRRAGVGYDLSLPETLERLVTAVVREQSTSHSHGGVLPAGCGESLCVINPARDSDVVGRVSCADAVGIEAGFSAARLAQPAWDGLGGGERAVILRGAADLMERDGVELIALMVREGGKTYTDAIGELREAVDFCRYYAVQAEDHFGGGEELPGPFGEDNAISLHGRGIFVCISPWNFPLAIFLGQVVAALAAGNAVLAKPAEQTPLIALRAVELLREAGVPDDVVHVVVGDGSIGEVLVRHGDTAGVAFTGSTETARGINRALAGRSGSIIPLIAETGGQNVMFADSTALPEQLTDCVVRSAFLSAGQRCSALRVLYVQDEVADGVISMICGAMDVLSIGDPSDMSTDIGPVIDQAAREGIEAHIASVTDQAWLHYTVDLPKRCRGGQFVSPHLIGIEHISQLPREVFGPVLHVIRYGSGSLEAIIEEAQSTGYGLTMGVHSRMDHRWRLIYERARAGNVYINRDMIGAVVESQPFGGQGLSGTGFKAGGPRYLLRFAVEKTLTVNTMAAGGSTELLSLSDDIEVG